jgi:integrase
MKRLCAKAGVRYFRFHPFRHQGASIMAGERVPLPTIQKTLGHSSLKTTVIYLHSLEDDDRRAMDRFEAGREKRGSTK